MTAAPATALVPPPAANRLTRRQDFVAVLQRGRRARHRLLTLSYRPNGRQHNRYGFAIGKRVGNAVTRNLLRRRLREIVRALPLATGYDIIIIVRPEAVFVRFDELQRAFMYCARRGGLLLPEDG